MTIRKTTSAKSVSGASTPTGGRPHHRLYGPHNVVIMASPSRRASLLQRQVSRALEVIDLFDAGAMLEEAAAELDATGPDNDDAMYTSPSVSTIKKPLPSSPSAFQISPNAVKRKRSHSTSSTLASSPSSPRGTLSVITTATATAAVNGSVAELHVDIETTEKAPSGVIVAKRATKSVTPSKRCKDKKKKQKVDVIERALKRFRTELRQSDEDSARSCFEFMSVCHRDEDATGGSSVRPGITTPRPTSDDCARRAECLYHNTSSTSSHISLEHGGSRGLEGACQQLRVQVGVAAAQGARAYMEDRYSVTARLFEHHEQAAEVQNHASLLAVYDGHNGAMAAEYAARRFKEVLSDSEFLLDLCKRPPYVALSDDDVERIEELLKDTFELVDDEIVEMTISEGKRDGSTVLLGLLIAGKLFVANLGDTRGVLGVTGSSENGDEHGDDVVRVSVDHKPDLKAETARVEEAGGKVIFSGCWRVAHDEVPLRLAVSRSLGDHPLKANLPLSCSAPLVSVVPDIQVLDISGSSDEVLVFATDGLWDRLSDDDTIRIARTKIAEYSSHLATTGITSHARNAMQSAAIALVETALVKRSMDNITAMVIGFSAESTSRLDEVEALTDSI